MKRTIEVTVEADGSIKIDALCFKGADCAKATQFLEDALGVVTKDVKKPEYNLSARQEQQAKAGGGR